MKLITKRPILLIASAVLLSASLLIALPRFLNAAGTEQSGDWGINCEKTDETKGKDVADCVIIQEIRYKKGESQGRLAYLKFGRVKDKKEGTKTQGVLLAPLGIMVQSGIIMQIDDSKNTSVIPIARCISEGCLSNFSLGDDGVEKLKKGTKLNLYYTTADGKKLKTSISLKGFSNAFETLKKASF